VSLVVGDSLVLIVAVEYLYGAIKTEVSHYAPGSQMGFYQPPTRNKFSVLRRQFPSQSVSKPWTVNSETPVTEPAVCPSYDKCVHVKDRPKFGFSFGAEDNSLNCFGLSFVFGRNYIITFSVVSVSVQFIGK